MAKQKPRKKGVARLIRAIIIVLVIAIVVLIGVNYLLPMLTTDSITVYQDYTVETGDIQTQKSFSGTLAVKKSETHTAEETTKVKELYVTSGDEVQEGDPLVLLADGELLTAGFDGVINEIRVSVGDWVRQNFSVVQVSDLVNLQVTMSVDEYDVKALEVGQSCTVKVISLDEDFETTIAHIDRVSSSSGTLAYYTVTCDLAVPEEVLPGMRTTVIIPDESVTDVTLLPMEALGFDDDDQAYVLLKDKNGDYTEQYVETGLSDGVNVEITSGVSAGDVVYAVSGTESVQAAFSLEDIYIALVGEKVVINQSMSQMMSAGNMQFNSGNGTDTSGMPTDGTDFTMPDSGDMPDMENLPDSGSMPDMGTVPSGDGTQDTQTTDDTAQADATAAQSAEPTQDSQDEQDAAGLQTTMQDEQTTNTEP